MIRHTDLNLEQLCFVMKVVYLDQNIASRLAMAAAGTEWGRIRKLLQQGFIEKKIICPMPFETLTESSACRQKKRNAIAQFFNEVSGGVSLKHFTTLVAESTVALVRDDYPIIPYTVLAESWSDDDHSASFIAGEHAKMKGRMTKRQDQFIPNPDPQETTPSTIFQGVEEERCGMIYCDLEKMELDPTCPDDDFESPWLVETLRNSKITTREIEDYKMGIEWLKKSALQNNENAQYELGLCYYQGTGLLQDYTEAYAWSLLAVMNGGEDTLKSVLQHKLPTEQVMAAQSRAKELLKEIESAKTPEI